MTTDAEKFAAERRLRHIQHLELVRELKDGIPHQAVVRPATMLGRRALIEVDFDALADLVVKAMLNKSRRSKAGAFSVKVVTL